MSAEIKIKIISFKEEYHKEYEFLSKQGNASRLVCELVRQYRLAKGGEMNTIVVPKQYRTNQISSEISADILDSAKDLLD